MASKSFHSPTEGEPTVRSAVSVRLRARELRILNAVAEALNSAADAREAATRTLALVADLLGLQTGWVWLLDTETDRFYNAAVQNLPPYLQAPVRMIGHPCWCLDKFRDGTLTPENIDIMACSRLSQAFETDAVDAAQGLRSHASLPLSFQGKPLGVMNLAGPAWRKLTRAELRLLTIIAYQVGIAVERARLAEEGARLARAEERARIAREIHDTLAQGLTAITLHIESALPHLENDPERARARLLRALETARDNLEEARRSVLGLRAAALADRPLGEALAVLARGFTSETGIRAAVRILGNVTLPLHTEAELFRIAQEALTNVRRHAGATEATIAVRVHANRVRLVVRDNGQGFDAQTLPASGQGLLGMRERARLIGGSLRLLSRPGRGTTVAVTVPLETEA